MVPHRNITFIMKTISNVVFAKCNDFSISTVFSGVFITVCIMYVLVLSQYKYEIIYFQESKRAKGQRSMELSQNNI